MVNSTNYAMVSTLAGLKRLEAQIQRAMLEAGGQAPIKPEQHPQVVTEKMEKEVTQSALRVKSAINGLDISA